MIFDRIKRALSWPGSTEPAQPEGDQPRQADIALEAFGRFEHLLRDIDYPYCGIGMSIRSDSRIFIQVHGDRLVVGESGRHEQMKGRPLLVDPAMTDSEFVQTCWLAVQLFEEHEMREHFTFRGEAIFGPHHNVHKLAEFANETPPDTRPVES
ncbi:MAG: hypothetical protein AAF958_12920 [Planctomycetota bacterium]